MYNLISLSTEQTIVSLLKPVSAITVELRNVCKQSGTTDCGLYALAYCTSLLFGSDPCLSIYARDEMRPHLVSCLEKGSLTEFPTLRSRRLSNTKLVTSTIIIEICPICLKSDHGDLMVACELCKKWFHKECVPPFSGNIDWICSICTVKFNK